MWIKPVGDTWLVKRKVSVTNLMPLFGQHVFYLTTTQDQDPLKHKNQQILVERPDTSYINHWTFLFLINCISQIHYTGSSNCTIVAVSFKSSLNAHLLSLIYCTINVVHIRQCEQSFFLLCCFQSNKLYKCTVCQVHWNEQASLFFGLDWYSYTIYFCININLLSSWVGIWHKITSNNVSLLKITSTEGYDDCGNRNPRW